MRKKAKKVERQRREEEEHKCGEECDCHMGSLTGSRVRTRSGRIGEVIAEDLEDEMLTGSALLVPTVRFLDFSLGKGCG